jgi:monomeric sarcosine oxidase
VKDCDVVVVGAGAMGSATAWWLARWGLDVVLLEQYAAGHERGSSHGSTRIFRLAYPDPIFVDMARRSLPLWGELEGEVGIAILATTGGIDYGDPMSLEVIVNTLVTTGTPHEVLGPLEAAKSWPGFVFDGPVLYQPDAGRISADAAVRALHEGARIQGATLRFEEGVRALTPQADNLIVVTTDLAQYRATRAVVTAGAWVSSLLAGLIDLPPLSITREQVFHFPSRIDRAAWPCFIRHGQTFVYGLASPSDEGIKVAEHHTGALTTAEERSFEIDEAGRRRVIRHVTERMPGLDPTPSSATTCLYTNSPDESFIIERHGPIVVGSPCSGHGFKFVPLIGRQLAELASRHS